MALIWIVESPDAGVPALAAAAALEDGVVGTTATGALPPPPPPATGPLPVLPELLLEETAVVHKDADGVMVIALAESVRGETRILEEESVQVMSYPTPAEGLTVIMLRPGALTVNTEPGAKLAVKLSAPTTIDSSTASVPEMFISILFTESVALEVTETSLYAANATAGARSAPVVSNASIFFMLGMD